MTPIEFATIVRKYDPDIDDLEEQITTALSGEIASASAELFAKLPDDLWERVVLIATARVAAQLFDLEQGDEAVEQELDQAGYEFTETEFQSAEDHAREAAAELNECEVQFLRGMLKIAAGISPSVHTGRGTGTMH